MLALIDTEFTDLLDPQLLSLGMVVLDGREFYAELDLASDIGKARVSAAGEFVKAGVLDLWGLVPGASGTAWEIGRRAGTWLLGLAMESGRESDESSSGSRIHDGQAGRVEVAFDYPTDYELLEDAIRDAGLWDQVREVVIPVNVGPLTGTIEGELAAEECFRALLPRGLRRHHALADALALRAAYVKVKSAAMGQARKSEDHAPWESTK